MTVPSKIWWCSEHDAPFDGETPVICLAVFYMPIEDAGVTAECVRSEPLRVVGGNDLVIPESDDLRAGLEAYRERARRTSDSWRRDTTFPTEYSRGWHDGYTTALATYWLDTFRLLDPEAAEHDDWLNELAARGTDADWFAETGCCGHCGNLANECVCTEDDPCRCGPHVIEHRMVPCAACEGRGRVDALASVEVDHGD